MRCSNFNWLLFVSLFGSALSYGQVVEDDTLFGEERRAHNLSERWDLTPETNKRTFTITPYKPVFILPARWTSAPNMQPHSYSEYVGSAKSTNYQAIEAKFQLSFKTKVATGLFFGKGDIWLAFTQTANWQAYNADISRPFRELNYEPEVIFNYPLDLSINDFKFKMVGVGFNHQSNGKSLPTSRSWNRFTMQVGMEYKDWTFFAKPWVRFHERSKSDDNPYIEDHIGKGEFTVIYARKGQVFTLMNRNNLRLNHRYKGFTEFTWAYPIKNNLKGFLVVNNGYGESMIDYNWNQTTIGVGVSLLEWL